MNPLACSLLSPGVAMIGVYCLLAIACAAPKDAALEIAPGELPTQVEVRALLPEERFKGVAPGPLSSEPWSLVLCLSLLDEQGQPGAAIFGKYQRRGNRLIFTPRYKLATGERYQARLTLSPSQVLVREYRVPEQAVEESRRPVVERIYPSGDLLPANQLKFYIYFSQPMRQGRAVFDQIHLLDEQGTRLPDVWRRTELWTPDAKRLTLWIHPGRVKQGVNLREEFGPVLHPDRRYSLVLDESLRSADGATLRKPFTKQFRTQAEDSQRPLPQDWKLQTPMLGTRQPLRSEFGEPLDYAMLQRLLTIHDSDGQAIAGEIVVTSSESVWQFQPNDPWQAGQHQLQVDPLLEDLAGNTPGRLFDTDLTKPRGVPPKLSVPFRPRP